MKTENKLNAIVCSIIFVILWNICSIGLIIFTLAKINRLENKQDPVKIECDQNITSFDCPFCQGKAVVYPIKDDWYIECDNCGIRTDFFDSKEELISYWLKVYGG